MPTIYPLLILITVLLLTSATQAYPLYQNQQRLTNVNYCGSMSRSQFINKINQYKQNTAIQASIASMFPANGSMMVAGLVQPNSQKIIQSIKGYQGLYFLHIGIIAIFLLLHILLTPILFCCGCCGCCTCLKFCKKYSNQTQSCQKLCLPATCIIMLIIALIVISSIVIKMQVDIKRGIEDFKCSVGVVTHDVIDGGQYQYADKGNINFLGLNALRAVVQNFDQNVTDVNTTLNKDITSSSKTMKSLKQLSIQRQDMISRIPNQDTTQISLQYPNPLLSPITPSTSYITSTFVPILGSINTQQSLISNLSISSKQLNQSLQQLSLQADNLSKLLSQNSVKNMTKQIKLQVDNFQQLQFQLQNTIGMAESGILKVQTIATYVLLGLTIFCSAVMCFQLLFLQSWRSYQCAGKYSCCCTILWLIGILVFVLALVFGVGNPIVYYGCQYARETVLDVNGFQKNAGIFGNVNNDASNILKNCLASSKNKTYLYNKMINTSKLQSLQTLPQNFPKNLSFLSSLQTLSNNYTSLLSLLQQYRTASITDLSQKSMIQQLQQIANLYQNYSCFPSTDRWVPSVNQIVPVTVGCANFTNKADRNSCNNWADFQVRSQECVGCLDTFGLLSNASGLQQIQDQLMKRYQNCTNNNNNINEPVNKLVTLWRNYYQPKQQILGSVKQRALNLATNMNLSKKSIFDQIALSYNQTQDWLTSDPLFNTSSPSSSSPSSSPSPSPLSPQQMDCRVLGISITNSINVACNTLIPYVYQARFLYYAAALLIFFISLCSTCMINRNNREQDNVQGEQQKSKKYKLDYGNPATTQRRYSLGELEINSNKGQPEIKKYF